MPVLQALRLIRRLDPDDACVTIRKPAKMTQQGASGSM